MENYHTDEYNIGYKCKKWLFLSAITKFPHFLESMPCDVSLLIANLKAQWFSFYLKH